MKKMRIILLIMIILINSIFTTGCWNYREVDKLEIVAGAAVDKGPDGQYIVTAELVHITGGRETKTMSETITMEGKTLFDAVRNAISLSGKKLYWSHTKVVILSEEIAREGVIKFIDWYTRDAETRRNVYILISKESSAREIFTKPAATEEIKSFVIEQMLKNEKSLSKAPIISILEFDNDLESKGISATAPAISLKETEGKMKPEIMGTAIIKFDKLIGFLNGEETKALLFINNKVRGGILVEGVQGNDVNTPISLEIYKSKAKVKPVIDDESIKINLSIDTTVGIGEIQGTKNYIDDEGRMQLEKTAAKKLKERIVSLIEKMQSKYDADIFGFGAKLREDEPAVWNQVSKNWDEIFKDLEVNVTTKVHIKNSAILSKTLKEDD